MHIQGVSSISHLYTDILKNISVHSNRRVSALQRLLIF